MAAWVFWYGGTTLRADLASAEARHLLELVRLGKVPPQDDVLDEVAQGLAVAARLTPNSPELYVAFGDLNVARSGAPSVTTAPDAAARQQQLLNQALTDYRQALALQPYAYWMWLRTASVQDDLKNTEGLWNDWRRARALGPNEWAVQKAGLRYALQDWPNAPADVRDWAIQLYLDADTRDRVRINNVAMGYKKEFVAEDDTPPAGAAPTAGQAAASGPASAPAAASTAAQ
ncbi:hypothetical protein KAK06_13265 [Ideonella sp. 4Y11]|uniref:Tetratricopeptide repeat protein n=1 Tax=Ideonella aquatica TaxID=2824119 RepID=A0A940YL01_9BURK|nr:hypothetical protein [Ideonella aquatica]MBQ0959916.1 hypothetical protein [Ideonella aquatica]